MDDIDDIKSEYEKLGNYLRLRDPDIQAIKRANDRVWVCLKEVIAMWLNRNTIRSEEPNRRLLVEAIRKINTQLANTLENKYKTRKVNMFII